MYSDFKSIGIIELPLVWMESFKAESKNSRCFFLSASESIPYENVVHYRKYFASNDLFGGTGALGDHEAILKTISINENVLQGVDNAVRFSMQIKGIIKMNGSANCFPSLK